MDDLMEGILGRRPEDMGLEVFDGAGAEPQACLYQSYPGPPLPAGADLPALDRQLEVGGRIWTLRFRPLPGFSQAMGGGTHWQVLLGGTATSLLILLSLLSLSASRKALEASEKHYRLLAENARDVIWTLDAQGRMDYMSPSIQRLRGLTPAEAMAQTLEEGVVAAHASRARVALEAFQQALLTGAPLPDSRIEVEQPRKDGSTVWTETSLNPLLDDQGRYLGVLGVSRDITQRVAAEQERRKLEAEVQHAQKLESLGSLAGGLAHDINNVLAAILSLASMHRQLTRDGEPLARSLDTIVTACERGRDVVRRLLYFARKGLESLGPVDLNILVMEVAHLLDSTTLKRVELQTDLQDGLEPIHGDAAALNHALLNVCINAVEAMPRGGVLRIATRREADGSQEVRVKDTGEGMSPEVAERAVEPFFTTKPVGKGTGLGLSMAYGTLEAHKGSLTIQSEPGKGTEVVLRFPRSH
jgi:PAS domain S-box-containing protein